MKDTEQEATSRYMKGGFGKPGSKKAYERYSAYVNLLRSKLGQPITKPKRPFFAIEDYFERRSHHE